jgi:FkbM family methyltransferase
MSHTLRDPVALADVPDAPFSDVPDGVFVETLVADLFRDVLALHTDVVDPWRHPAGPAQRVTRRVRDRLLRLASRAGFTRKAFDLDDASARLRAVLRHSRELEDVYRDLGDSRSRALLLSLLRFKILGARHVALPLSDDRYWDLRRDLDRQFRTGGEVLHAAGWTLQRYRLPERHGNIELHADRTNILNTFLLEQYAYRKIVDPIRAAAEDVVIDAGGCWGDSALYFAHRVGPLGRVFSFECIPDNLRIFRQNVAANPALADRIEIIERAVWSRSGERLTFQSSGPGAVVAAGGSIGAGHVTTAAIDEFVAERRLDRVDFLKMDIEGAEPEALLGAARTIRRFAPTLAIAVYHRDDDLYRIPAMVKALDPSYECYLDHFTTFDEETILFARSPDRPRRANQFR